MKRIFCLFLGFALCLSLAACGSNGGNNNAASPAPDGNTTPSASEPAENNSTADLGAPVMLTAATSMNETDALGLYWVYFKDYVEEKSGGNITIDLYSGGTLGTADQYLDMMKSGTLDLCGNYAPFNAFNTPAFVTVLNGMNSASEALEYAKYIAFEDPDSSAVFAAESAEYNATLLGCAMPTGYHVFVSTKDVSSYQDLLDTAKLGSVSESCYTAQGFKNFVTIDPSSVYESLRTGVCDCVDYETSTIMTQKLYELAKTICIYKLYPILDFYCVNTDTWNGLTDGQRQILTDAAQATMDYACQYVEEMNAEFEKICAENNVNIIEMSDEEFAFVRDLNVAYNYNSMLAGLGSATGKTDDLIPCVKAGMTFYAENYGCDFGDIDQFIKDAIGG